MVLAAGWLPIRAMLRNRRRPHVALAALVGLAVAVVASAAVITPTTTPRSPAASQPYPLPVSARARLHLWEAALDTWLDRPVVGAGAGAYYEASVSHQGAKPSRFAHNLPLELAAELGVLGLLLGISLYATAADLFRRADRAPELWLLGPAVGAFLVANLFDWPWHLAGLGAVWAAAAGGLMAARRA
jgi:O-antigen ligase